METLGRVLAAQGGDPDAFGDPVRRYHAFIYRLCYRMTGGAADAEDLAQETFVEAYLKLGQLRDPERFGGWMRTLALNLCRVGYRAPVERRASS